MKHPQFTCPKCGSHHFGTTMPPGSAEMKFATVEEAKAFFDERSIGHCHGYGHVPCEFTWPRKEDSKYFTPRESQ